MLATKGYSKDQIVSFKLVNGDEIVAKVVSTENSKFVLSKPCTIMPSQRGLGLIQSVMTSDLNTTVELDFQHVMMHAPTIKEVIDHYIQTTTGITPVSAGGIIT